MSSTAVLYVGDSVDIPAIRRHVSELAHDAYGQIYLEVASEIQIQKWDSPPGLSVTWLCRDRACAIEGTIAPRGELMARAIEAWVSEWMPEEQADDRISMWVGLAASSVVAELYDNLSARLSAAVMHKES